MFIFQMDLFTIDAVDMVSLTKVVVEYEGEGQGKGWFLEKVIVKDSANPDFQYTFSCDRCVSQITNTCTSLINHVTIKTHFVTYKINNISKLTKAKFAYYLLCKISIQHLTEVKWIEKGAIIVQNVELI